MPRKPPIFIGLDRDCIRYSGLRAWQLPGYPPQVCPTIANVSRGRELNALLHDPMMGVRLLERRHRSPESVARARPRYRRRGQFRSAAAVVVYRQRFIRRVGHRARDPARRTGCRDVRSAVRAPPSFRHAALHRADRRGHDHDTRRHRARRRTRRRAEAGTPRHQRGVRVVEYMVTVWIARAFGARTRYSAHPV